MKILQINNYHFPRGGSDRYFLDLSALLIEHGHDVKTFSTESLQNTHKSLIHSTVPTINTSNPALKDIFSFLYSKRAKNTLVKVLNDFKPDIIHLHIYYGQLTGSILTVLKNYSAPIVQTLHEYKLVCPISSLYANGKYCEQCHGNKYWKAIINKCNRGSLARSILTAAESYVTRFFGANDSINHYIAVSNYQTEKLIKLGLDKKKITTIANFTNSCGIENNTNGDYYLYVGRITEEKGVKVLIKAYSKLKSPRLPLRIVGEGEDKDKIEEYANKLGLEKDIIWDGYKTGKDLENIFANSLVVINPSLLNETFGLTCLEAMAHGKPVIASRTGAFPELVKHNFNGFLYNKYSETELFSFLKAINNTETVKKMSRNAHELFISSYTKEQHCLQINDLYNELIKK
ncbi:MAG: glycosyltransferase family 4 protein [Kangiellaceae bacterium]|nr:glycosyltransferase family 4 protein [Kangiellaceae bacterium]